ncbi:MAG: aminopeptidase [Planctomycetota bacterium]
MRDPRLDRLADVLVSYSTRVKPGEKVLIEGDLIGRPLAHAIYERVLAAGAHPFWYAKDSELDDAMLAHGSEDQLGHLPPYLMTHINECDVRIAYWAERNTRSASGVDPARSAAFSRKRAPYMKRFMEREGAGELRWVGTQFPTDGSAQDAEMSLAAYCDFVFKAGLLDHDDPAASWRTIAARQQLVCDWLNTKKEVRFRRPACERFGETDLTVSVDGSNWINCGGDANFPDGEVFAGPRGVDGVVCYTFPAVHNGREVEGVRLRFEGGRVIDASATKNEAFLIAMLDQDEGARTLGEIAIGTNYAITDYSKNTLFDEKIGGTFHAAVGAGYPESGNTNESALHWDMVCDLRGGARGPGGTIEADGELFHRDGLFLPDGWPRP